MERKYDNGFEIINETNNYQFYLIKIVRKEKSRKCDTCPRYHCHVWFTKEDYELGEIKDEFGTTTKAMSIIIKESTIDNILNGLNK